MDAALSCGVFFSGSFSRKSRQNRKQHEYTLAASLVSTSQQGPWEFKPISRLPRAVRVPGESKRSTLLKHLRSHGTHYVAGYEEGYTVLVKARFESDSAEEATNVITAFKAAIGSIRAGDDTSYTEQHRSALTRLQLEGRTISGGMTKDGKDCSALIANTSVDEAREFLKGIREGDIIIKPARAGVVLYSLADYFDAADADLRDLLREPVPDEWE